LTLQTTYKAQVGGGCCYNKNKKDETLILPKKIIKKKEYKLSVERLLQKSKQTNITEEQTSSNNTTTTTTCCAHSSLQLSDISIRAFAIQIRETNNTNHANNSSSCSHDDQATVDTHHNSLGGTTRSVTTTTATTTNKEGGTTTGDGSSGEMMMMNDNKKHATSVDNGTITSSSSSSNKYALMIKYHHFDHSLIKGENDTITAIKTKTERINLDFRPISVHLTQLHSTLTSSSSSAEAAVVAEDGSVIPIVGVFVAGDDNKLHFFVTTMQDLKKNLFQQHESGAEPTATTTTSEYTSCFQSALCFEMIDPSNIISTSPSNNSEYHNDSSVESVDDNPLMFATPIMAIDTCISEGHGEMMIPSLFSSSSSSSSSSPTSATTKDKVNQLAIACYDGVIRILTYTIECTLDANIMIRIGKLQYSTFIVDGPVATLHFHSKATQTSEQIECDSSEEKEKLCDNNLFLLAGSLCGLAFLFYEVPPPSTARIDDGNTTEVCSLFEGPVVVVDGLYDADKEGFEDCVTAVHVMRYYDVTILAVGTQGCRLLMFQQQQQQQNRSAENEARKGRDKYKTLLTAEIENKTEEMMHLSTERDRLTNVVSDLRQKLLDVENNDQEEDVLHGDAIIISRSGSGIESDECEDDVKADQVKKDCISIAPKVELLKSIKAEIDDIEQSCLNCTSKISQLQSLIDDLTDKLNEIDLDVPSPLLDSKSVRKLHRYEYLWEHKLPYPIQGIGSAVCTQSGDLECYITTRQTLHIFRLLSSQMVEAAATSLERKILSFVSTAEDGC